MTLVSRTESHCELPCATWGLLTGGGEGPAARYPGRGGDLGQALCRPLSLQLRSAGWPHAPCVRSPACAVRVPSARPRPLSPALSGKEDLPSAHAHTRAALLRKTLGAPGQPWRGWRAGTAGGGSQDTLVSGLAEQHFPGKPGRCVRTRGQQRSKPGAPAAPSCLPARPCSAFQLRRATCSHLLTHFSSPCLSVSGQTGLRCVFYLQGCYL